MDEKEGELERYPPEAALVLYHPLVAMTRLFQEGDQSVGGCWPFVNVVGAIVWAKAAIAMVATGYQALAAGALKRRT